MITSFTIKKNIDATDREGRNVTVSLIRGNNTVSLPVIREDELAELAKEIIRYLVKR